MQKQPKNIPLIRGIQTLIVCCGFASTTLFAAKVVAKNNTPITSEPKKDAVVLQELKQGEEVEVGERKGLFWEVKLASGQKGFVSFMAVKKKEEGTGGISEALRTAAKETREKEESNGSRARTAVMGVRGLTDKDKLVSQAGSVKPDLRAVFQMEDTNVDKSKIEALENKVMGEISKRNEE